MPVVAPTVEPFVETDLVGLRERLDDDALSAYFRVLREVWVEVCARVGFDQLNPGPWSKGCRHFD